MQEHLGTVLLAESIARRQGYHAWLEDTEALKKAASVRGSDADKLHTWVHSLAGTEPFKDARKQLNGSRVVVQWLIVAIATILGLTVAGVVLASDPGGVVNVSRVVGVLIGAPFVSLMLWVGSLVWLALRARDRAQAANGGLFGQFAMWLSEEGIRGLAKPAKFPEAYSASVSAGFTLLRRNSIGPWVFSAATHVIWAAFIFGALLGLSVQFSILNYDFRWETTILSDDLVIQVISIIAWLPGLLGMTTPDMDLILESRFGARHIHEGPLTWGRFLVGSVILWALLPRLVLALICYLGAWRSVQSTSIDLATPLFQQALSRIKALEEVPLPHGRPPEDTVSPGIPPVDAPTFGGGDKFVLIGFELDQSFPWPPQISNSTDTALVNIRTRDDERTARARLTAMTPPPAFIVVIASIARAPDRDCIDTLREIGQAGRAPILLILTEVDRLKERQLIRDQQEQIWRDRARRAGVAAITILDLRSLEKSSPTELKAFLQDSAVDRVPDPPSGAREE